MTRSLIIKLTSFMAILAVMCLTACESNEPTDPVAAIPPDAKRATVLNLDLIARANDAPRLAEDDHLLPAAEEALAIFLPADLLRPMAAILSSREKGVDTTEAVMFTAANGYTGLILKITDRDLLTNTLLPYRDETSDFDKYEIYTTGRRLIALSENLCIIAPDVTTIKSGLRRSSKGLARIETIRDFLNNPDNAIRSVCPASDIFGKKSGNLWLCTSIHFTGSTVIADLTTKHSDGSPDSIGARIGGVISPDVAACVPSGSTLVIAGGLQRQTDRLFDIEQAVKKYVPGEITMSKSGTTLWYARPAGTITPDNLLSPEVWNFASVTQMPREDGYKAVGKLQQMTGGVSILDHATGCYTYNRSERSMSYGYVNGYFVQSTNGPITLGSAETMRPDFKDSRFTATLDIPAGSTLRKACELPCGASLTIKATTDKIHAKLSFYGNSSSVISTVKSIPMLRNILPYITGQQ